MSISNLGNLLSSQMISFIEYLERIPKGLIPDVSGLINSRKQQEKQAEQVAQQQQIMQQQAAQQAMTGEQQSQETRVSTDDISDQEVLAYIKQNNPQVYEQLLRLSPEDQQRAMAMMRNGAGGAQQNVVGDL